jgi:hypothetical protein
MQLLRLCPHRNSSILKHMNSAQKRSAIQYGQPTPALGLHRQRLDGLGNWKSTAYTQVDGGGSTTAYNQSRNHNYVNQITSTTTVNGGTATISFSYDHGNNTGGVKGNGNLVVGQFEFKSSLWPIPPYPRHSFLGNPATSVICVVCGKYEDSF